MNAINRGFRLLAVVLIVTLAIGLATPGRAEAIEPLVIVSIVGIAVIVVVVVVYLIVANMYESKSKSVQGEPRYLACVESDVSPGNCWALSERPAPGAAITIPPAVFARATQSP
jgi:hypothetical protein